MIEEAFDENEEEEEDEVENKQSLEPSQLVFDKI